MPDPVVEIASGVVEEVEHSEVLPVSPAVPDIAPTVAPAPIENKPSKQSQALFSGLVKGRIVRYVDGLGEDHPAIVTKVQDLDKGLINITAFLDCHTPQWFKATPYGQDKGPGTWHWPGK